MPAFGRLAALATVAGALFASTTALGGPLAYAPAGNSNSIFEQALRDGAAADSEQEAIDVPARLRRQIVAYSTHEAPGTIVIDTANTHLYYVLGGGKAVRYGVGVGREGFTWSGTQTITRKTEWPDWIPPAEMLVRQPYLPRFMAGGPSNPLGARAMYLGGTVYRIHGTNAPTTIGGQVSSGCIRMLNEDVIDLYARTNVGTKVVVLPGTPRVGHGTAALDRPARERPVVAARSFARTSALY
jgi:lipoprotein-anchoring transpeptidase ErfK/SrfK